MVGSAVAGAVSNSVAEDPGVVGPRVVSGVLDPPTIGCDAEVTTASVGSVASSSSPEQAPPSMTSAANAAATEPRTAIWAIVSCDLRC
jgi:hypothetical protein